MKPLACIYVCHADSQTGPNLAFEKTFAEHFKKSSTIIWVKQSAGMGWQDYRAQHEPFCMVGKMVLESTFLRRQKANNRLESIGRDAQASICPPNTEAS
jgi:hypothetical protein